MKKLIFICLLLSACATEATNFEFDPCDFQNNARIRQTLEKNGFDFSECGCDTQP